MNIITRGEWGAAPPRAAYVPARWGAQAVIHHTAGEHVDPARGRPGPRWWLPRYRANRAVQKAVTAYRRADSRVQDREAAAMRQMQGYHQRLGWTDLGYHFVIFPSGRVYEGRPRDTVGAHAVNGNRMPGISCAGNYEKDRPTADLLASIRELQDHLGVPVLIGHYKVPGNSTACPGRHLKTALGV